MLIFRVALLLAVTVGWVKSKNYTTTTNRPVLPTPSNIKRAFTSSGRSSWGTDGYPLRIKQSSLLKSATQDTYDKNNSQTPSNFPKDIFQDSKEISEIKASAQNLHPVNIDNKNLKNDHKNSPFLASAVDPTNFLGMPKQLSGSHLSRPYFQTFSEKSPKLSGFNPSVGPTSHFSNIVPTQRHVLNNNKQPVLNDFGYPRINQHPNFNPRPLLGQPSNAPNLKTNYPNFKTTNSIYAPSQQTISPFSNSFQSVPRKANSKPLNPTSDYPIQNHPFAIHLEGQNTKGFEDFVKAIESQPLVLNPAVINFANEPPYSGGNFNFVKQHPGLSGFSGSAFNQGFGSPIHETRIIPVHSASSTPQLPQYKGAVIGTNPTQQFQSPDVAYQPIHAQPLLHFGQRPVQPVTTHEHTIHYNKPSEEIRSDAEVIKKKKKPIPPPVTDDNDSEDNDEGYKSIEKEYDYPGNFQLRTKPKKSYKNFDSEDDFERLKSSPLKAYDETFGRFSKDDEESKSYVKHRYPSISHKDEDEEYDDKRGAYHDDDFLSRKHYDGSEEDGVEEESQKRETREKAEEDPDYQVPGSKHYRSHEPDFDREFEESYHKELPQNRYVHIKEVPEIEDPLPRKSNSKSSKSNSKEKRKQRGGNRSGDQTGYQTHIKPDTIPKSSEGKGYESYDSYGRKSPKVIYESSFEIKDSRQEGDTELARNNENSDSRQFPRGTRRYSGKSYMKTKSPESDSYSRSSSIIRSVAQPVLGVVNFAESDTNNRKVRYITNEEIFRDLIGI